MSEHLAWLKQLATRTAERQFSVVKGPETLALFDVTEEEPHFVVKVNVERINDDTWQVSDYVTAWINLAFRSSEEEAMDTARERIQNYKERRVLTVNASTKAAWDILAEFGVLVIAP